MVKPRRYWPSGIAKRCSCCAAIGNIYTRLDTTGNGYGSFSRPFPNPQPKPTQPRNNPKAGSLRNHGLAPGLDELIRWLYAIEALSLGQITLRLGDLLGCRPVLAHVLGQGARCLTIADQARRGSAAKEVVFRCVLPACGPGNGSSAAPIDNGAGQSAGQAGQRGDSLLLRFVQRRAVPGSVQSLADHLRRQFAPRRSCAPAAAELPWACATTAPRTAWAMIRAVSLSPATCLITPAT